MKSCFLSLTQHVIVVALKVTGQKNNKNILWL